MKSRLFLSTSGDLAYAEIPKCGCSTLKQYLYRVGNGVFFDGIIHRAGEGIVDARKRRLAARVRLMRRPHHRFTFVRNPYARVLSAFFDKIANPQIGGEMYGKPALRAAIAARGIDPAADPQAAFRRFVVLVRDTVVSGTPIEPDIHWMPMAWHAAAPLGPRFDYDEILHMETFEADLRGLLTARFPERAAEWAEIQAFNEGSGEGIRRTLPVADHYDATARLLMEEAFADDFDCFGYSRDPAVAVAAPRTVEEINARLRRVRDRLRRG